MKRIATELLLALLLLALAGSGYAQQLPLQQEQSDSNRNAPAANVRINDRQAINLAKARFPGNVLRISLIGEGENQRYQIRMENEGKVFTVFVHVLTGRVTGPG